MGLMYLAFKEQFLVQKALFVIDVGSVCFSNMLVDQIIFLYVVLKLFSALHKAYTIFIPIGFIYSL